MSAADLPPWLDEGCGRHHKATEWVRLVRLACWRAMSPEAKAAAREWYAAAVEANSLGRWVLPGVTLQAEWEGRLFSSFSAFTHDEARALADLVRCLPGFVRGQITEGSSEVAKVIASWDAEAA